MAMSGDHQFDRRVTDVNVSALSTRMASLEGRVEVLENQGRDQSRELRANTVITGQAHDTALEVKAAVIGDNESPGLKGRVDEMYEIFEGARNGFRVLGKAGNAGIWIADRAQKIIWIGIAIAAVVTFFKTGHLPEWAVKLFA